MHCLQQTIALDDATTSARVASITPQGALSSHVRVAAAQVQLAATCTVEHAYVRQSWPRSLSKTLGKCEQASWYQRSRQHVLKGRQEKGRQHFIPAVLH